MRCAMETLLESRKNKKRRPFLLCSSCCGGRGGWCDEEGSGSAAAVLGGMHVGGKQFVRSPLTLPPAVLPVPPTVG